MQNGLPTNSEEVLIDGVRKCMANSLSLIEDAILLNDNNRNARAYTLYQLAIEEIGKGIKLMIYILDGDFQNRAKFRDLDKEIRDHKSKTKTAGAMDWFLLESAKQNMKGEEIIKLIRGLESERNSTDIFNDRKNYSLYTSFVEGVFKTPIEIITGEELTSIEWKAVFRYRYANGWIEAGLSNLKEIKEYIATHRDEPDLDKIVEAFWEGVEF